MGISALVFTYFCSFPAVFSRRPQPQCVFKPKNSLTLDQPSRDKLVLNLFSGSIKRLKTVDSKVREQLFPVSKTWFMSDTFRFQG